MFKKHVFFVFVNVSLLFANIFSYAEEKVYSIKESIQINETRKFNEIQIGQKKYLFKLYNPTINYFGKETVNDIETNQNHSPLLFDLAMYKTLTQTNRPISERFSEWLSEDRDPETKWNMIQKYYADQGENITKDNFDKVILNYHKKKNIQIDYMGEVRKDNFAAIIVRRTEKSEDSNRVKPLIFPMCYYKKDGRWYNFSKKDYTELGESEKFFQVISDECWYNNMSQKDSIFYDIFLASEALTREREPWWFDEEKVVDVTAEVWHEWETHIGDINVIGKFISYEGKYVTVEKKDGERVKLEY
ncbi:MAG: hypothetical protein LBI18_04195, partial [Planctomycetaceae bacterium]|nr:hypothetical protein [Planctomycetaceae bacterium]